MALTPRYQNIRLQLKLLPLDTLLDTNQSHEAVSNRHNRWTAAAATTRDRAGELTEGRTEESSRRDCSPPTPGGRARAGRTEETRRACVGSVEDEHFFSSLATAEWIDGEQQRGVLGSPSSQVRPPPSAEIPFFLKSSRAGSPSSSSPNTAYCGNPLLP